MTAHEGAAILTHDGRSVTLRFTWSAIESVRGAWGDDYAARMSDALEKSILPDLAFLVATTGDMTADAVMEWSPPVTLTAAALTQAWRCAWLGAEAAKPKADDANPMTALPILSRLLGPLGRLRFAPASAGANSGT